MKLSEIKSNLIIGQERYTIQLIILAGLVLGLIASLIVLLNFRTWQPKAKVDLPQPSAFISFDSPFPQLNPPYLRLVSSQKDVRLNQKVLVDVYLHTNGQPVMEADLYINYDPVTLDISAADIKLMDVFKSINIEPTEPGSVVFSVFITPSVGHQAVVLNQETKIATLEFTAKTTDQGITTIDIDFDKNIPTTSALIAYSLSRSEEPANILQQVAGLTVNILP